jgi:hypothetical protein
MRGHWQEAQPMPRDQRKKDEQTFHPSMQPWHATQPRISRSGAQSTSMRFRLSSTITDRGAHRYAPASSLDPRRASLTGRAC